MYLKLYYGRGHASNKDISSGQIKHGFQNKIKVIAIVLQYTVTCMYVTMTDYEVESNIFIKKAQTIVPLSSTYISDQDRLLCQMKS